MASAACSIPLLFADNQSGEREEEATTAAAPPVSVDEARGRARLLHEVVRGSLQVMHRDFFDPDDRDRIPSSSLEDMFEAVEATHQVKLKWLGVNAKVMDVDHKAKDEFEKQAVAALSSGKREHESVEDGSFRFVGAIRLHNSCLKCHVPFRQSQRRGKLGVITSP